MWHGKRDGHHPGRRTCGRHGKLILPGGADPHTHFDRPMFGMVSSDDHYTGHKAAAFDGTTTVIDFVSFDFPSLRESIDAWHRKAEKAAIDFSFHMNLTKLDDAISAETPSLVEQGITTK
jgi:dihydropyrimidinase